VIVVLVFISCIPVAQDFFCAHPYEAELLMLFQLDRHKVCGFQNNQKAGRSGNSIHISEIIAVVAESFGYLFYVQKVMEPALLNHLSQYSGFDVFSRIDSAGKKPVKTTLGFLPYRILLRMRIENDAAPSITPLFVFPPYSEFRNLFLNILLHGFLCTVMYLYIFHSLEPYLSRCTDSPEAVQ
jgi:hypothetical protein